jgi:hypothetical protein
MAKYNFSDVQSPDSWGKLVSGQFVSNDASSPTVTSGTGWSVARTGAGVHQITLTGKVGQIIATTAGEQYGGAVDTIRSSVTAVDHNSSTFDITTVSGSSGAARAATDVDSDVVVHFMCFYRSTKVQP